MIHCQPIVWQPTGCQQMPKSIFPLSLLQLIWHLLKLLKHNSLHAHVLCEGKIKQLSYLMVCPCSLLSQQICNIRRLPAGKVIVTWHHRRSCNNKQCPSHGMCFLFFIKIVVDTGDVKDAIQGRIHLAREVKSPVLELWFEQEKHNSCKNMLFVFVFFFTSQRMFVKFSCKILVRQDHTGSKPMF